MSFPAVWKKIEGKSKLIWVFKSKNGTVFGAYTPCIWAKQDEYGVGDELCSFIFSYQNKEFFPIRNERKKYTQLINISQYLLFGGTHSGDQDLRFETNFVNGFSKLGVSYEASGKDSNYLFGGPQPNVIEFEIYQIN